MSRTVAILGGGDWADASVEHLEVRDGVSLEEEKAKWNIWYRDTYCPSLKTGPRIRFLGFAQWLIDKGVAWESDIETFYD
jgi:hypothetical protein